MNDIIWRTIKRAQVPAVKEQVSLTLEDNERPDVTTLLPWAKGKPLAWDVTVPDTYAESHIADTVSTPGAAAHQAAQHKIAKYSKLASTHMFYPTAIETAGTWDDMAIELIQEVCRRTSHHPGHQRNSLSVSTPVHSPAEGECGRLPQHNEHRISRCSRCLTFCLVFTPAALCWWQKNNNSSLNYVVSFS